MVAAEMKMDTRSDTQMHTAAGTSVVRPIVVMVRPIIARFVPIVRRLIEIRTAVTWFVPIFRAVALRHATLPVEKPATPAPALSVSGHRDNGQGCEPDKQSSEFTHLPSPVLMRLSRNAHTTMAQINIC